MEICKRHSSRSSLQFITVQFLYHFQDVLAMLIECMLTRACDTGLDNSKCCGTNKRNREAHQRIKRLHYLRDGAITFVESEKTSDLFLVVPESIAIEIVNGGPVSHLSFKV